MAYRDDHGHFVSKQEDGKKCNHDFETGFRSVFEERGIKVKPKEDWKTTRMASGIIHEMGDKRIIEEENEKGDTQYRIGGTNGKVFSSLEEAKNAVMGKKVETPEDVKEFTKEHYKGAPANYEEDDIPGATRYRKTTEDNNDIIILKLKENGKYRAFMDGASIGNGDFASFEEAEKAVDKEKQKEVFEEGEEVKINYGYDSPTKAKILRKMPQKELDDLHYSLNPKAPGGYYEVEEEGFMGNKNKRVVWARRIDRKK